MLQSEFPGGVLLTSYSQDHCALPRWRGECILDVLWCLGLGPWSENKDPWWAGHFPFCVDACLVMWPWPPLYRHFLRSSLAPTQVICFSYRRVQSDLQMRQLWVGANKRIQMSSYENECVQPLLCGRLSFLSFIFICCLFPCVGVFLVEGCLSRTSLSLIYLLFILNFFLQREKWKTKQSCPAVGGNNCGKTEPPKVSRVMESLAFSRASESSLGKRGAFQLLPCSLFLDQ